MVQTEAEAAAAAAAAAPAAAAVTFSMELSDEQRQLQKWVHDFAKDVIRPAAHEWDEREETPWPIIEEAAKVGIYSWEFVQNSFADPTGLMMPIVNEEITWGDAGIGLSLFGSSLAVAGIVASGTMEQVAEWVPQCFGTPEKIQLGAFGVSEADGGIADVHVLVVSVEPELGSRGHAAFVIPPGTKGISQGQKYLKHGIRASHTAEVVLDDCIVPGSCLLGGKEKLDARIARAREGKSSRTQAAMATFEASRPAVGAQAVGVARAAYEFALDYAKERVQFGRAIIENQAIAFKLADMKTSIDASRLLVWRAAWMAKTGQPFVAGEGSMSKLFAGETAVRVTDEAIQILGAMGYIRDNPVERWHRDSKIYTIFEGTSEIQRLVIARAISGIHIK